MPPSRAAFLAQGAGLAIEDAGVLAAMARAGKAMTPALLRLFLGGAAPAPPQVRDAARANAGFITSAARSPLPATPPCAALMAGAGLLDRYGWLYGLIPKPRRRR